MNRRRGNDRRKSKKSRGGSRTPSGNRIEDNEEIRAGGAKKGQEKTAGARAGPGGTKKARAGEEEIQGRNRGGVRGRIVEMVKSPFIIFIQGKSRKSRKSRKDKSDSRERSRDSRDSGSM